MTAFSPAARDLVTELRGTLLGYIADGRVSTIEGVAALKFAADASQIELEALLDEAAENEALGNEAPPET